MLEWTRTSPKATKIVGGPMSTMLALATAAGDGYAVRYIFAGGFDFGYDDGSMHVYDVKSQTWTPLQVGEGTVFALECGSSCSDEIYVGGSFSTVPGSKGPLSVPGFARYDVKQMVFLVVGGWMGSSQHSVVFAISAGNSDGYVYIGGEFSSVNGIPTTNVAAFNTKTQQWESRSGAFSSAVVALCFLESSQALYAGGSFSLGNTGIGGIAIMRKGEPSPYPTLSSTPTPSTTFTATPSPTPGLPFYWDQVGGGLGSTTQDSAYVTDLVMGADNVLYISGYFDACNVSSTGRSTPTSPDVTSLFLGNSTHGMEWRAMG